MKSDLIERLDATLDEGIARLTSSRFVEDIAAGRDVRAHYVNYIRQAYHYVRQTSSFTPLSARRMDAKHLALRQWILHHSAHEIGHALMALADLELPGHPIAQTEATEPLPGTWLWVNFFYYQVSVRPPFAAMGVLYFLEGMAARLAPIIGKQVAAALAPNERAAMSFLREHGELDVEHSEEGKDMLVRFCTDPADQDVVNDTIRLASYAKRAMLDQIVEGIGGTK